jgi:hypothetical protein
MFKACARVAALTFLGSLIVSSPTLLHAQSASDFAQSRLSCAQGLAQQSLSRVQAMGVRIGAAEMCVKALSWTANNGDLLDIYKGGAGHGGGRILVDRFTDNANASSVQFRASGSPLEMWNRGILTPSLAFDAGFTRSYLEKTKAAPAAMSSSELQKILGGCLNEAQSLAACAEAGRVQGALAFQMNNAFTSSGDTMSAPNDSQGPNRAQTSAAVDQKFQSWAQSWSFDRYRPGSAQITGMTCADQCKAEGKFSFDRMGSLHTIPFVAYLTVESNGKYSLGRVCYNDETTKMLDCTQ